MLHGFVARFYYYFLGYDISNASGIPRARYQFAMVSRQCPFYEPARMCCCYYICGTRLSIPVTIFRSFSKAKRYRIAHKENPPHEIWINARSRFPLLRLIVTGPSLIYRSVDRTTRRKSKMDPNTRNFLVPRWESVFIHPIKFCSRIGRNKSLEE